MCRSLVFLAVLALGGCEGVPVGVVCPGAISPAVEVEVWEAATGRPAAARVSGWVRDGAFRDSLRVVGWTGPAIADSTAYRLAGAYERSGTYTVRIDGAGYRSWERTGVRARPGACGVETVRLRADLLPAGAP